MGYLRDKEGVIEDPDPFVFFIGEQVRLDALPAKLDSEREYFRSINTELADVTVEIRADADVPTGMVQQLIKYCQEAEFERFALKATQIVN